MKTIIPNFNDVVENNGITFTPGDYVCKIIGAELKIGREKGTQYINWKLETIPNSYILYHNTPIEGRGANMFKHFVHCTGDTNYSDGAYDIDFLIGKTVLASLEVEKVIKSDGRASDVLKIKRLDKVICKDDNQSQQNNTPKLQYDDLPF